MQEKKILFVPAWYPDRANMNSGNFVQDLALHVSSAAYKVDVTYLNWSYKHKRKAQQITSISDHLTEYRSQGFFPPRVGKLTRALAAKAATAHIIKHSGAKTYDIVHVHSYVSLLVGLRLAKHYSAKLVISLHHKDIIDGQVSTSLKKQLVASLPLTDCIIVPSAAMKAGLQTHFAVKDQATVIPNYVDVSNIPLRNLPSKPTRKTVQCLAVGTFNKNKNHQLLVNLWSQLPSHYHLTIVGEGHLRPEVEEAIGERKLKSQIKIIDPIKKSALLQRYAAYDIFVGTCILESFCMTMLEAIATGVPVVTTTKGGPSEFITTTNGILTTETDFVTDLQQVADQLVNYSPESLRASVRHLTKEHIVPLYTNLYQKL